MARKKQDSIETALLELVKQGAVEKTGDGKDAKYKLTVEGLRRVDVILGRKKLT